MYILHIIYIAFYCILCTLYFGCYVAVEPATCPTGWYKSGNMCFFTPQYKKTFEDAKSECANLEPSGRLAETRDSLSLTGVTESIKKANLFGKHINS